MRTYRARDRYSVLATLQIAVTSHGLYFYLVTSIGNLNGLSKAIWYEARLFNTYEFNDELAGVSR